MDEHTLIIGDAHIQPGQSHRRFEKLNNLVKNIKNNKERLITKIVVLGDWIDMASLSRFDSVGSKAMEGTRIEKDIAAGAKALQHLTKGLTDIPFVFVEGNHEERIKRMEEEHPRLLGMAKIKERFSEAVGGASFTYIPYREYVRLSPGLVVTHVPHNNMKPIASTIGARKVLALATASVIYGHTHQLDFATLTRNNGKQIFGLNAGCFIEPNADPPYMQGMIKDWWRGVVIVHHNQNRPWDGSFSTISLKQILYGELTC